jgi:hypothetical protein
MKAKAFYLALIFFLASCTSTKKNEPIGTTEKKEPTMVKKDTIDVFEIIAYNLGPEKLEPIAPGAESKEVVTKTIFKYDDSNADTILATLKIIGFILPSSIPNPPPKRPYEEFIKYKFYKLNEKWKVEELK